MVKPISEDFLARLEENRQLFAKPGLGRIGARFWSTFGLHTFWWLLGLSWLLTILWLRGDQHTQINNWLFGWLY